MELMTLPTFELKSDCLANKIILVTGASRGIGRALAFAAAKHGATVILLSKDLKRLESVYDEIVAAGFPEPAIQPTNLRHLDPKQANDIAQSIQSMFGRLDAIVHNAGISGPITPIEHIAPEKWQEVIHLNLNVPFLLSKTLLPLLMQSASASILFTAANEGFQAKAYWGAYAASKAGVLQLAEGLHQELETNTQIRVNCINPGVVRTALRVNAYPGIDPLTFAAPEDIVNNYIYLLSDAAKEVRGKCVQCMV
ncbi:MAG: YciK family oxidoreductase [Candidatus Berkiellales bacterium]